MDPKPAKLPDETGQLSDDSLGPLLEAYHEALLAADTDAVQSALDATVSTADLDVSSQANLVSVQHVLRTLVRARSVVPIGRSSQAEGKRDSTGKLSVWDALARASGDELPLRQLGRFTIQRELGRGGFSVVFLAHDPVLNREVALKVPRPEVLITEGVRLRFDREAQAVARLTHPNLVPLFEVGEAGAIAYIVSAYCAGPTLAQLLHERGGPVAPRAAARMVEQLADAVHYAHTQGVLHRDIKPGNVLLEPVAMVTNVQAASDTQENLPFVPKLVDFGLAKWIDDGEQLSRKGELLGTPAYMAPEQAACRHTDVGVHTDVYGLGAILFELLTGGTPFVGSTDSHTLRLIEEGDLSPTALRVAGVTRNLEAICLKCLAKTPSQRYASAAELLADLNRYLAGVPVAARSTGRTARAWHGCRRRPVVSALSAGLAAVVIVSAASVTWQWRQAVAYANQVERSLIEAEQSLVNWAWVQDEALRTPKSNDPLLMDNRHRLQAHYQAMLALHAVRKPSRAFQAATASLQARVAELSDNLKEANGHYDQSIAHWRELLKESPANAQYRRALAENLYSQAELRRADVTTEEREPQEVDVQRLYVALLGEDQGAGFVCLEYARLLMERGEALSELRKSRDAFDRLAVASGLCTRLATAQPDNREFMYVNCQSKLLWAIQLRRLGGNATTVNAILIAEKQARILIDQEPLNEDYRVLQAHFGRLIAQLAVEKKEPDKAVAYYEVAYQSLHGLPEDHWRQHSVENLLASTARELANLYQDRDQPDKQLAMLVEATQLCERARDGGFISRENLGDLGFVYQQLADGYRKQAKIDDAKNAYTKACEVLALTAGRTADSRRARLTWADCHASLAELDLQRNQQGAALAQYQAAITVIERLLQVHPRTRQAEERLSQYRAKLIELSSPLAEVSVRW